MQTTKNQNMAGTKVQTSKVRKCPIFPDLARFSGETGYKQLRLGIYSISTECVQEKVFSLSQRSDFIDKPPVDRRRDHDIWDQTQKKTESLFNVFMCEVSTPQWPSAHIACFHKYIRARNVVLWRQQLARSESIDVY